METLMFIYRMFCFVILCSISAVGCGGEDVGGGEDVWGGQEPVGTAEQRESTPLFTCPGTEEMTFDPPLTGDATWHTVKSEGLVAACVGLNSGINSGSFITESQGTLSA